MEKTIQVNKVSKEYKLFRSTKERILDLVTHRNFGHSFWALKNVSFEAEEGDVIAFVGINGSGKSTLSNIIAGIVPETSGEIYTKGQASLIAVNAGLKPELTGRENIELKCLMLGFSKKEIEMMEDGIIEFAELEHFIDQPIKSYSSGMKSRLGFAISVSVDPDILIIDEALSVGDKAFSEKSFAKMQEFKQKGKTMLFVTHSLTQVEDFCNKVLWLEFGHVKKFGDVDTVLPEYKEFLQTYKKMTKAEKQAYRSKIMNDE